MRRRALAFLAFLIAIPSVALASSCPSKYLIGFDDPARKAVELSDVVFVGEVQYSEVTTSQLIGDEKYVKSVSAAFAVKEVLKGELEDKVLLAATDICHCRHSFEVGVEYLILGDLHGKNIVPQFCKYVVVASHPIVDTIRAAVEDAEIE